MLTILTQRVLKYSAQAFNRFIGCKLPFARYQYFAFGANVNVELLNQKRIYPGAARVGMLRDHEFAIESPCEMQGLGFASARRLAGSKIYGLLIEVSAMELLILDLLEWRPFGLYGRYQGDCELLNGEKVRAIYYRTKVPTKGLKATARYRDVIVQGAKQQGFPQEYINALENMPVGTHFPFDHGFRLSNPTRRRHFERELLPIYSVHDRLRERLCQLLP